MTLTSRACAFDYSWCLLVNEKQDLSLISTLLLVSYVMLCSHVSLGTVWQQLKASLESYGLVKKVWEQLKSLSHLLLWNKHSSAVVQDLTPSFYNKTSLLCQNLMVRSFHKRNSNAPVIFDTLAFQLHFLWLQANCQQVSICSTSVV